MTEFTNDQKSLILTLEHPAKIYLGSGDYMEAKFAIGDKIANPIFQPWKSFADLLYESESNLFVGMSYYVSEAYQDLTRDLLRGLDPAVVRYVDHAINKTPNEKAYKDDYKFYHVEITWTDKRADALYPFENDDGYFFASEISPQKIELLAFGVDRIDRILRDENLVLPDTFPFPCFTPEVIKGE